MYQHKEKLLLLEENLAELRPAQATICLDWLERVERGKGKEQPRQHRSSNSLLETYSSEACRTVQTETARRKHTFR